MPSALARRVRWLTRLFVLTLLLVSILAGIALVRAADTAPGRRILAGYRLPARVLIEALRVGSSRGETERAEEERTRQ